MSDRLPGRYKFYRNLASLLKQGYALLVPLPLVVWTAYALGGEQALAWASGLAMVLTGVVFYRARIAAGPPARDAVTGLEMKDELISKTDQTIAFCQQNNRTTACILIEVDSYEELQQRYGATTCDRIMEVTADRIMIAMRADDTIARIGDSRIGITLHAVKRIDLELSLQLAARLQTALEDPIAVDASSIYVTVSLGICTLSRAKSPDAQALIDSAHTALLEARRSGPSAIRVFSPEMKRVETARKALIDEAFSAFENGEICAWFQPQISTDTGQVSGVEALARWVHPQRGMIAPAEFLPALETAGLLDQLNETMVAQALGALRELDREGIDVPQVGVNFSPEDLRNPKIIDRLKWDLDRFELEPHRLTVEILESAVAGAPDDVLVRNITELAAIGCHIDLDDFGTGHASITSIKRLPVDRLKIDRSFVMKCDTDPEQQRMLTAILTMAEKLELDTLAEGLETVGEHALISQLGVGHVQGFGIARPMPKEMLIEWIQEHTQKIAAPPAIGGSSR